MILKALRCYLSTASPAIAAPNLPYPFEYTFKPEQFKYKDIRFEQFPAVQQLSPNQKQHITYTLTLFTKLFNKNITEKATTTFISPILMTKVQQFKQVLKQMQISAEVDIDNEKCARSAGYLQYYGYKPQHFIHQYSVNRLDDKVMLVEKEYLKKMLEKTDAQQLKEDMKEIEKETSVGKKLKQKIFKEDSKKSNFILDMADMFTKSYQKSKQVKKFKSYILVNQINSKIIFNLNSKLFKNGPNLTLPNIDLTTKWSYQVTSEQPEAVRKSRKRILFDFQLWNRGTFVPIRDFSDS